jgi:hypothetical protein
VSRTMMALLLLGSCNGDKDDGTILPPDDTDADADADTDTDTDTDADTDTEPQGLCDPLPVPSGATPVAAGADLAAAVSAASSGDTLALADGTYEVSEVIVIDKPLTLMSQSQSRTAVTIDGEHAGTSLFQVTASDVTFAHLTLTASYDELIDVNPAAGPLTGLRLHDLHLLDPGRYAVLVQQDEANLRYVDDGEVSCSTFELTVDGQDYVREQCNTGGLDVYAGRGWTVRDSEFEGFWCQFGDAGPALRFTRGARDVVVTRNRLLDNALGIVVGETRDQIGRVYEDDPCGDVVLQAIDSQVTNNIVASVDDDLLVSSSGILTGIRAESSCNVSIIHNSVYSAIEPASSIEHTYETTTGILANNLVSHAIRRQVDSAAVDDQNLELVPFDTWYYPADDDFHTAPGADWAIDQGSTDYLDVVDVDVDGEARSDGLPDIGADEVVPVE